ncbi:MAG TPA: hypothetical protein VJH04_04280 [archaeon]|nr:hypothetical protein [archaeon]
MNEEAIIKDIVLRQKALEESGINDPKVACAAGCIISNIRHDYPTADLITAYPFSDAFAYLVSAGLVTTDRQLTEKGRSVYNLEDIKVYPIH